VIIGQNNPKRGQIEPWASNLPGIVSSIRRSPRNTYWVSFLQVRHAGAPGPLDQLGNNPGQRGTMINSVRQ
jgi:hypothetical protein